MARPKSNCSCLITEAKKALKYYEKELRWYKKHGFPVMPLILEERAHKIRSVLTTLGHI